MQKKTYFLIALIIIISVGAFLRIYHLDTESLWLDEVFALRSAEAKDFSTLVSQIEEMEGSPFGYHLLLRYWIQIFGNSPFSIRFPSLLFGVLSIFLLYRIGLLLFNEKTALLSALFLSTSMLQVLYSQEARLYALSGFLALLSAYFFLKILRSELEEKKGNNYYFFYGLIMLISLDVNYLLASLLVIYSLVLLAYRKNLKLDKWILTNSLVLLLAIPVLPLFINQFLNGNAGLKETLIGKGLPSLLASLGVVFYALPVVAIIILAGLIFAFQKKIEDCFSKNMLNEFLVLAIIVLFAGIYLYLTKNAISMFGIPLTRNPITHSYFLIRYPFFFVPILYLLVAEKINRMKSKKTAFLCLGLILAVNFFSLSEYYDTPTKAQWQEAMEFIAENSQGSPTIYLDSGGISNLFLIEYYSKNSPEVVKLTWNEERRSFYQIKETELFSRLEKEEEFWLVLSKNGKTKDYYKRLIEEKYEVKLETEFYEVKVYRYENRHNY